MPNRQTKRLDKRREQRYHYRRSPVRYCRQRFRCCARDAQCRFERCRCLAWTGVEPEVQLFGDLGEGPDLKRAKFVSLIF